MDANVTSFDRYQFVHVVRVDYENVLSCQNNKQKIFMLKNQYNF